LKGILKQVLVGDGFQKMWVCEGGKFLMPENVLTQNDALLCLQEIFLKDGIHFTPEGYGNFAGNVSQIIVTKLKDYATLNVESADVSFAVGAKWYSRSFLSPIGVARAKNSPGSQKSARLQGMHPYGPPRRTRGGRRMRQN
jgi:hypothetical protein